MILNCGMKENHLIQMRNEYSPQLSKLIIGSGGMPHSLWFFFVALDIHSITFIQYIRPLTSDEVLLNLLAEI